MVSAKTRASPGKTPYAEATGAGAVAQVQSWRRRGPAASTARTRVAGWRERRPLSRSMLQSMADAAGIRSNSIDEA